MWRRIINNNGQLVASLAVIVGAARRLLAGLLNFVCAVNYENFNANFWSFRPSQSNKVTNETTRKSKAAKIDSGLKIVWKALTYVHTNIYAYLFIHLLAHMSVWVWAFFATLRALRSLTGGQTAPTLSGATFINLSRCMAQNDTYIHTYILLCLIVQCIISLSAPCKFHFNNNFSYMQ